MKLLLPAVLQPISRRKDKSSVLKLETRELQPAELIVLMALEGSEGWIQFSPNQTFDEAPEENAHVSDLKTPSERLRDALYVVFKQETTKGTYVGLFQQYYDQKLEKYIQHTLSQLDK